MPSSQTTASSGDASATGIQSQSIVNNTTLASVQVGGTSSGDVKIDSVNKVEIVEAGGAVASSGDVMAAPQGTPIAVGTPKPTKPTTSVAVGATSASVATVGLQAQNSETVNLEKTATAVPNATGTLTVQHTGQVTIQSSALGAAASEGACAGDKCVTPTKVEPLASATAVPSSTSSAQGGTTAPTTGTGSPTGGNKISNASSGSAEATGLVAQNVVNTSADVKVTVKGENHGLIQVLIESITEIFNFGWASASTGNATASNNGAASPNASGISTATTKASSGNAQATGAEVDNKVDISSSSSVKVERNNYNPINIFINLFAQITNIAVGMATSGNAEATGSSNFDSAYGSGQTASSGSAKAIGLDTQNQVNMSAAAAVDIDGSNYADINIRVRFHTIIENIGIAFASTGIAKALGNSAAPSNTGSDSSASSTTSDGSNSRSSGSDGSGGQNDGGSTIQSSVAKSGDATAHGHNSSVQIASAQHASGNGDGEMNAVLPPVSNSLPEPRITPEEQNAKLPEKLQQLVEMVGDIHAQSGNAISQGFTTGDAVLNVQVAHAVNPGSTSASATNSYEFNMTASGDSSAQTGFAGVNATPTPMPPTPRTEMRQSESDSDSGSVYHNLSISFRAVQTSSSGYFAGHQPFQSTIKVKMPSKWPEFDRLPMPWQKMLVDGTASSRYTIPTWGGRPLVPPADETRQVTKGFVDIDPMGVWPGLELPPMPDQVITPPAEDGITAPLFGMPEPRGKSPWNSLLWSLMGMLIMGVMATRKGRGWISTWTQACLRQAQAAARLMLGLILR